MIRVMVFGTFDNLHPGHLDYFSQAHLLGEELIVIIARDSNVLKLKGRPALENERRRLQKVREALEFLGMGDQVILGDSDDFYAGVRKYQPAVIALGYDQVVNIKELKAEIRRTGFFCRIVRLKSFRPDKYKSSYCLRESPNKAL